MHDHDGWMWGHDWAWGGGIAMGGALLLFVAAVILALVTAVRYLTSSQHNSGQMTVGMPDRAQALLAERFARGEIDEDEYRQRLTVLRDYR